VSENKSEEAGAPEIQLESADEIGGDTESPSKDAVRKEAGPAAGNSGQSNGGSQLISEKAPPADEVDESLGAFLIGAREGRGLTAEDVVRETRLPHHYLRMMETNDYSEISDQLYLVPFLRRYATFLELDQEDVAMRFIREVQRADSSPGPARLDQPLIAEPHRRRGWAGAILVLGFLVVVAGVYLYESDKHRQVSTDALMPHTTTSSAAGSDAGGSSTTHQ
jgi:Helix-turn-helix domain